MHPVRRTTHRGRSLVSFFWAQQSPASFGKRRVRWLKAAANSAKRRRFAHL